MTIGLGAGAGFRVLAIAMAFVQTGESGGKSRWVGWENLGGYGLSADGYPGEFEGSSSQRGKLDDTRSTCPKKSPSMSWGYKPIAVARSAPAQGGKSGEADASTKLCTAPLSELAARTQCRCSAGYGTDELAAHAGVGRMSGTKALFLKFSY